MINLTMFAVGGMGIFGFAMLFVALLSRDPYPGLGRKGRRLLGFVWILLFLLQAFLIYKSFVLVPFKLSVFGWCGAFFGAVSGILVMLSSPRSRGRSGA
ncbi:MAG: hypothetical protein P8Z49_07055 [Acidobacteriota bacterium]|jgi:hypothetical protein